MTDIEYMDSPYAPRGCFIGVPKQTEEDCKGDRNVWNDTFKVCVTQLNKEIYDWASAIEDYRKQD